MNANQLMGIFVAVILLGSTAGFALWFSGQDQDGAPPNDEPPPIENPTLLSFSAEDIEAEVIELFASAIISSPTQEAEIAKIDAELTSIEEIRSVRSHYRQLQSPELSSSLVYMADITFVPGTDVEQLVDKISEATTYLDDVTAGIYGLVAVPNNIVLENPDLNLMKNYTFEDPLIQAYLSIQTQKQDKIMLGINITFSGEAIMELVAIEIENITAAPQSAFLTQELELTELTKEASLYSSFDYSNTTDANSLEQEILALQSVEAVTPDYFEPLPILSLTFEEDANFLDLKPDLNTQLPEIFGVEELSFLDYAQKIELVFNKDSNLFSIKEQIQTVLQQLNVDSNFYSLEEPKKHFQADLNLTTSATTELANALEQLLSEKDIEYELYQKVKFNVDELTPKDQNKSYAVEDSIIEAMVLPGHSVGDGVELDIFFQGIRGMAENINAIESTEEEQ